jgi:hypothetical protein
VRSRAAWLLASASAGLLALALVACSSEKPKEEEAKIPAPETQLDPGALSAECQALLQKSADWGYTPGQKWHPSSQEQALEVVRFFGDFHFVPQLSSEFYRAFMNAPLPSAAEEAAPVALKLSRAQLCDAPLAYSFLDVLVNYKWAPGAVPEAKSRIFQFVLNQQARVMPFVPRVLSLDIYRKAAQKGLARGNASGVSKLMKSGEAKKKKLGSPIASTPTETLNTAKEELQLSEEMREGLARLLPLP